MSRHLLSLVISLTSLPLACALGDIGVFEHSRDIPPVGGAGHTEYLGYVIDDDRVVEQYRVTGQGDDIWGARDAFHFAYRAMSGQWRVSAEFEWVGTPQDDWAKQGVMIRASTERDSVHYDTIVPNYLSGNSRTDFQWRSTTGGSSAEQHVDQVAARLGIQRVLIDGQIPAIESIADFGDGWERIGELQFLPTLADEALFGVCVTSHTWNSPATSLVSAVVYESAQLVGPAPEFPVVPAGSAKRNPGMGNGFVIRTVKAALTDGWDRVEMNKLLDFGCTGPLCLSPGMSTAGVEEDMRLSRFVNLHDAGGRGVFGDDESFPGVDPFECPTADPAAGDDDNNFATEVLAIIHLTAGLHIIGVNDRDGTVVEIGGIEIGRTNEWKDCSTTEFVFGIEQEGFYTLHARHLAGVGGAAFEMHEVIQAADGSGKRILLGDVAHGGSAVYVPEPATIALLGLAVPALRRTKRS